MPTFGKFESTRELHRSGLAVVYAAREAGSAGPERFAVKEIQLGHGILRARQVEGLAAEFLGRAEVQMAAAKQGSHWAPVHDSGRSEDGAYIVTDLYPRSAQRLASGRVKLDSADLRLIVDSVLQGLAELRASNGRAHGNLKLANVLITETSDGAIEKCLLTDPAPDSAVTGDAGNADMHALGEVIHELVLHQAFRARTGWPVPTSPAWARLGVAGEGWRALCNRLLDPSKADSPPSIEEITAEVAALPQKRGSRRGVLLGAAGGVVVAAAGVAGYIVTRPAPVEPVVVAPEAVFDEERWAHLCTSYYDWFGGLAQRLDPKVAASPARQRFSEDAHLARIVAALGSDVARLNPMSIAPSPHDLRTMATQVPEGARTPEAIRRTREAAAVIDTVASLITVPGLAEWKLWAEADRLAAICQERDWNGAADHLRQLRSAIRPSADLIASAEQLLDAGPFIAALDRLDKAVTRSAAFEDRVLSTLDAMVASAARQNQRTTDMVRGVMALDELTQPLMAVLADDWDQLDLELFERSAAHLAFDEDPTPRPDLLSMWLAEARNPRNRLLTEPDPREPSRWDEGRQQIRAGITRLTQEFEVDPAQGPQSMNARLAQIEADIAALMNLRWNAANRADVSQGSRRVAEGLTRLAADVTSAVQAQIAFASQTLEEVRREYASLERIAPSGSQAVDAAWRTGRDHILRRDLAVTALREQVAALQELLREVDAKVPTGVTAFEGRAREWMGGMQTAASQQREQLMQSILSRVDWDQETPTIRAEPEVVTQFAAWLESAGRLMVDVAAIEDRLDGLYPLAQQTETGAPSARELLDRWTSQEIFAEPTVQTALAAVLSRVRDLERLETVTDRAALLATAADVSDPARAVAAWRRLGTTAVAWPPARQSLDDEVRLQRVLAGVAGAAPEARRAAVRAELADQARRRWASHVSALTTHDEIQAAAELAQALGGEVSDLSPRALFNIRLSELQRAQQDESLNEEQLTERIESFRAAVVRMAGIAQHDAVAPVLAELGELTSEAPEVPAIDVRTLGPGNPLIGWAGEVTPDGQQVTFRRRVANVDQVLTFVRVEPSGGAPAAFISTQEVPLGLFIGVVGDRAAWEPVRSVMPRWDTTVGEVDPRPGPRVWDWIRGPRAMNRASRWLADNQDLQPVGPLEPYPSAPGFPPPGPALEFPMQYVSPHAAVLMARLTGCRVPSTLEWQAALAIELGGGSLDDYLRAHTPNLRDETWALQKRHVDDLRTRGLAATNSIPPSAGSLWRQEAEAHRVGYTDGALWPVPVAEGRGRTFLNLIGNVAEVVFEEPELLEQIPPDAAPAVMMDLIRGALSRQELLGVIGGSAQSPPSINPVERQALPTSATGYSDVGLRLAFSAAGTGPMVEPLSVRLGHVLGNARYLPPG